MVFYSVFLVLWHLGALLTSEDCPSQDYLIPRDSKQLACKSAFHKQTPNLEPMTLLTICSMGFSHSGPLFPCPNHSRVRYQTKSPMSHSSIKVFKLANPKLAYSASPVPSWGNHTKGSCPHFPPAPLPPDPHWHFPMWLLVLCSLLLGSMRTIFSTAVAS